MFNVERFWYKTYRKTLEDVEEEIEKEETVSARHQVCFQTWMKRAYELQ